MPMIFHDRKDELKGLDDLYTRGQGILAVAYGRRGIGKTMLIHRWIATRRHRAIFWDARPMSPHQQLQSFSQAVRAFASSEAIVLPDFTYASWDDTFEEILGLSQKERLVVVLDNFDQLIACGSDLPSALQRIWDHRLQSSDVMLFLIGSNVRVMEYDVLSYRAPMYGRAWWIAHLRPFPFAHLKLILPHYSLIDRITLYACVGGVPRHLELLEIGRAHV
jgi:AAA+ ATPase superfamily predicted ATPase